MLQLSSRENRETSSPKSKASGKMQKSTPSDAPQRFVSREFEGLRKFPSGQMTKSAFLVSHEDGFSLRVSLSRR